MLVRKLVVVLILVVGCHRGARPAIPAAATTDESDDLSGTPVLDEGDLDAGAAETDEPSADDSADEPASDDDSNASDDSAGSGDDSDDGSYDDDL